MDKRVPEVRFKGFTDDWEQQKINEVAKINPTETLPEYFEYVDLDSVKGTSMISHKSFSKNEAPSRAKRLAKKGDIFFQTVRPYQKNNFLFYSRTASKFVFSTGYAQLRPIYNGQYLFSIIQREHFVAQVMRRATGTGYPAINSKDLMNIPIRIPNSLNEQMYLGKTIDIISTLINDQKKQLTLYEGIKKYMLQNLFPSDGEKVPNLRFFSFTDDWKLQALNNMGTSYSGLNGKNKNDFGHGTAKFITYMNVFSNPISNTEMIDSIEEDNKQHQVRYGDVLFTISSETPDEVGMSSVWLGNNKNIYLNSFCFGYHLMKKMSPFYLAFMLRSPNIRKKFKILAQGISRYNISAKKVMDLKVPVTSLSEQNEIGDTLRKIDLLIDKEKEKILAYKKIKSYCLQRLFV